MLNCVFKNCVFKTNVYGTFSSHRSRKHKPHSLEDFKEDILMRYDSCTDVDMDDIDMIENSAVSCTDEIDVTD